MATTTLWLLWMALRPGRTLNNTNLIPFAKHSQALVCLFNSHCLYQHSAFWFLLIDVAGNIVVFIPPSMGLAGVLHRANRWQTIWRVVAGGFILSLTIELTQLAIPSRATDVDDLIFNTLGAILGVLFFLLVYRLKDSRATSGRAVK